MTGPVFLAIFIAPLVGFALLAATQDQHRRAMAVPPASFPARRAGRAIATALILIALTLAIWVDGPGLGTLLWLTSLSVTAGAVTMVLSWRPSWLRVFARALH